MQNFGKINETFKDILAESITTKDTKGKKLFKKYVKTLKESKVLKTQYQIYNNIETKTGTDKSKVSDYVKESITLLKGLGIDNIVNENKKLITMLSKDGFTISNGEYENKELHENISDLTLVGKTTNNIDSLLESNYFVTDYILENQSRPQINEEVETFSNNAIGKISIDRFNEKYASLLDESEKLAVKTIINGNNEDKEKLYTDLVRECIDLVNVQLLECSIDEKDKLLQAKDKLLRFNYNEKNFVSEISRIVGLKNSLK